MKRVSDLVDRFFLALLQCAVRQERIFFKEEMNLAGRLEKVIVGKPVLFVSRKDGGDPMRIEVLNESFSTRSQMIASGCRDKISKHQETIASILLQLSGANSHRAARLTLQGRENLSQRIVNTVQYTLRDASIPQGSGGSYLQGFLLCYGRRVGKIRAAWLTRRLFECLLEPAAGVEPATF